MAEHLLYPLVFCSAFDRNLLESCIAIYVMYHAVNPDSDFLPTLLQEEIVLLMQTEGVRPRFNDAAYRLPGAESVAYMQISGRCSFTGLWHWKSSGSWPQRQGGDGLLLLAGQGPHCAPAPVMLWAR